MFFPPVHLSPDTFLSNGHLQFKQETITHEIAKLVASEPPAVLRFVHNYVWAQDAQQPAVMMSGTSVKYQSTGAMTADKQKMNSADRDLTKKIRAALHGDSTLSTYAHNIKIVSQDGKVTLKGPVRSDDEKSAIEAKATEIAGAGNVTNQLTVVAAEVLIS